MQGNVAQLHQSCCGVSTCRRWLRPVGQRLLVPSASSWKAVTMKIAAGTTLPIVLRAWHTRQHCP